MITRRTPSEKAAARRGHASDLADLSSRGVIVASDALSACSSHVAAEVARVKRDWPGEAPAIFAGLQEPAARLCAQVLALADQLSAAADQLDREQDGGGES